MPADGLETPLRFVVTVDTEADDAWSRPTDLQLANLQQIPRFQDLCDKYGVVPTYLLAYECAARDEALSILKPLADHRRCEIGHHLHVWTTPPFQNERSDGVDHDWIHAFQFQLPDSLFVEKAEMLRQAIELNFGQSPTSHRAGRWGIDQRTIDWLVSSDFIADTSMRYGMRLRMQGPGVELSQPPGRAIAATEYDFHRNPYVWQSTARNGTPAALVELSATVDVAGGLVSKLSRHYLTMKWPGESILLRVDRKLGGQRMLRPDPGYAPGALPKMMKRAIRQGVTVINLMLHSSELALHCSPFTTTQHDLDSIWSHLEEAFRYAHDRRIESEGISDVARSALQKSQHN
jgi:hypothetical protein